MANPSTAKWPCPNLVDTVTFPTTNLRRAGGWGDPLRIGCFCSRPWGS